MSTLSTDIPQATRQKLLMLTGLSSGIASASLTHFLDVGKVLKQVGKERPKPFSTAWFTGMPAGALAQGQRFAVTLVIDNNIQETLKARDAPKPVKFVGSMVAAGLGEFLTNPPVVVKNYQIAMNLSAGQAIRNMKCEFGDTFALSFFRGVLPGTVRKALANAIVLQTIRPTREFLYDTTGVDRDSPSGAAIIGFAAGAFTGSLAEIGTNAIDRVKTLQQTSNRQFADCVKEAVKDPFLGAGYAGLRKGAIRGINWAVATSLMSALDRAYRRA